MLGERGQATSDYVAVVLVVGVVALAAATAGATAQGRRLAGAVQQQMARALCVVRGGDCDVDRAPCVVAQRRTVNGAVLTVAIVQIGHDRTILREQRSDRKVAVTLIDRGKPGLRAGFGLRGRLSVAGRDLAFGGEVSAAAVALFGKGRVWVVPDARAADLLIERIHSLPPSGLRTSGDFRGHLVPIPQAALIPPADQTIDDHGLVVSGRAAVMGASVSVEAEDVFGTRTDRASGQVTAYVRRRNSIVGSLATTSRGAEHGEQYAVKFDRDGHPLDLIVLASGTSTKSKLVAVTSGKTTAKGSAGGRRGSASAWTTETHLDLTDPDNLAAANAYLAQVRSPKPRLGDVVEVSDALRRRIEAAGVVHARTFEVEHDGFGAGARASVGVQVGFDFDHTGETARLTDASTRGVDGVWRRRDDCLTSVADTTDG